MVDVVTEVRTDLEAESAYVDSLVADVAPEAWASPTPAAGWTVGHQIAHLAWTDDASLLAIRDPDAFRASLDGVVAESMVDTAAEEYLDEPARLLARWRRGRAELQDAIASIPSGQKVPWYGTPMSAASMATARLMETWAHGLDVADGLGRPRSPASVRLRHIARLGFRVLPYAFAANGRPIPEQPVHVRLAAPDGTEWTFGPAEASNVVTGSALDFCLRVTQRAHLADLDLVAVGPVATEWLEIAQAFAGLPGPGRAPTGGEA